MVSVIIVACSLLVNHLLNAFAICVDERIYKK